MNGGVLSPYGERFGNRTLLFLSKILRSDFNVKKVLFVIISIVLIAACLSGCVSTGNTEKPTEVHDCGHSH